MNKVLLSLVLLLSLLGCGGGRLTHPNPLIDAAFAATAGGINLTTRLVGKAVDKTVHYIKDDSNNEGYKQEFKKNLKAAEQGDAQAQSDLGHAYYNGQGVPQDYKQAVKWYRKAAEQGFAKAQYNLGRMHALGLGVPVDYAQAVKWFREGAEQGDALSHYNLGVNYALGKGVIQDYVRTHMHMSLAMAYGEDELAPEGLEKANRELSYQQIEISKNLAREWMRNH